MSTKKAVVLATLPLAALALCAAEPPRGTFRSKAEVYVRTVLVTLIPKGERFERPPAAADLEVLEDGKRVEVLGLDPLGTEGVAAPPPSTSPAPPEAPAPATLAPHEKTLQVLYFDLPLLQHPSASAGASLLEKRLPELLANGPVEIVVADPEPLVVAKATDNEAVLRDGLKLVRKKVGKDTIARHRADDVLHGLGMRAGLPAIASSQAIRVAAFEEMELIRRPIDRLADWVSRRAEQGVLYLVNDGFDEELVSFYSQFTPTIDTASSEADLPGGPDVFNPAYSGIHRVDSLSTLLASRGWTAILVVPSGGTSPTTSGAAEFGRRNAGITTKPLILHPLEPLRREARATGGEVVLSPGQLAKAITRIRGRYRLSYTPPGLPDGKPHTLAVRSRRADMEVRAPESVPAGTPESMAEVRARQLLRGDPVDTGLNVTASVTADERGKRLTARVSLGEVPTLLDAVGEGRIRMTFLLELPRGRSYVRHDEKPLKRQGPGDVFVYDVLLSGKAEFVRGAVVAEELVSGAVGGAVFTPPPGP